MDPLNYSGPQRVALLGTDENGKIPASTHGNTIRALEKLGVVKRQRGPRAAVLTAFGKIEVHRLREALPKPAH
jgi:hypothetical protein